MIGKVLSIWVLLLMTLLALLILVAAIGDQNILAACIVGLLALISFCGFIEEVKDAR